jgi:hypothetical protein
MDERFSSKASRSWREAAPGGGRRFLALLKFRSRDPAGNPLHPALDARMRAILKRFGG